MGITHLEKEIYGGNRIDRDKRRFSVLDFPSSFYPDIPVNSAFFCSIA